MLLAFEQAERETDAEARRQWLTFVVSAAGRPGSSWPARSPRSRATRWRATSAASIRASARVVLVEAGPRILPAFPEELSREAQPQLEALGVRSAPGAA